MEHILNIIIITLFQVIILTGVQKQDEKEYLEQGEGKKIKFSKLQD